MSSATGKPASLHPFSTAAGMEKARPRPLRVVKRWEQESQSRSSIDTDESLRGAEAVGEEEPLRILKRRTTKGNLAGRAVDDLDAGERLSASSVPVFGVTARQSQRLSEEHATIQSHQGFPGFSPPSISARQIRPERSFIRPPTNHEPEEQPILSSGTIMRNSPRLGRVEGGKASRASPTNLRRVSPLQLSGDTSETCAQSSAASPSPSVPPRLGGLCSAGIPNSYVLTPSIIVTPEVKVLEDGQTSVWAAIEISGRLCQPLVTSRVEGGNHANGNFPSGHPLVDPSRSGPGGDSFPPSLTSPEDLFRYGCLYNVTVEILPTPGTSVIQVLDDGPIPTTICPGASLLLLANIWFDSSRPSRKSGHTRQQSDDLIEDLEIHLGSASIEYLRVHVRYCHSAFPEYRNLSATAAGVSDIQSQMETTATAIVKRHNIRSPWSPRPAPMPNPLFAIARAHWGAERAADAMAQILSRRSTARRQVARGDAGSGETVRAIAPPVPARQASLLRDLPSRGPSPTGGKIRMEMRQTPVSRRPNYHVTRIEPVPSSATCPLTPGRRGTADSRGKKETEKSGRGALRTRRSVGGDAIKGPAPAMSELAITSREDEKPVISGGGTVRRRSSANASNGRWGWTGWW